MNKQKFYTTNEKLIFNSSENILDIESLISYLKKAKESQCSKIIIQLPNPPSGELRLIPCNEREETEKECISRMINAFAQRAELLEQSILNKSGLYEAGVEYCAAELKKAQQEFEYFKAKLQDIEQK